MALLINLLVVVNVFLGIALIVALIAERDQRYAAQVRAEEHWKKQFRGDRWK
ncbi:MAG: hypothetical protein AAF092_11295 [Pseudomonadota bacterium]